MTRMASVLTRMEQFPDVGITSPSVDEPGMDNPFSVMRRVIVELKK
jgi:hypothetical protein